jgi:hypothetical protein
MDINDFTQKNPSIYSCIICDFKTSNKKDYNRHLQTKKHLSNISQCKLIKTSHDCKCGKTYKDYSGLWRHKKRGDCIQLNKINESNQLQISPELTPELILTLIKQNSEFQNLLLEQNKTIIELSKNNQVTNYNTNTNNNNSHNKTFNLQFFLNETCKDAMNITDFVDSLKLQLSDLEGVGELGYVEGISNIIVRNLNELDVTQRPVHCTDKKRETIYIKDENKWEKDEENKKMHKFVKKVADKNARLLLKFKEKYPDYKKSSSPLSDQYNKILIESMGGSGDNDFEKEEKIIKKIAKRVFVEKG